ncbi:ABC transporter [Trypanosoma cruzi]|nr:ABC transporter [Trypanosoma cruzi]
MDLLQVKAVLDARHPDVVRVFQDNVPEVGLRQLDECVLEYLLKMLEGQMNPASYLPEETIRHTLKLYLAEFAVCPSEDALNKAVDAICSEMETRGLAQKPKEDVSRLVNAVSIGRQYEENLRKRQ